MHSTFMSKSTLSNKWLIVAQGQVGQLGDKAASGAQAREPLAADRGVAEFQLEVGDDGGEIGVAAALAVAVHTALDVRSARLDGGDTVGDRGIGVVVGMDAD